MIYPSMEVFYRENPCHVPLRVPSGAGSEGTSPTASPKWGPLEISTGLGLLVFFRFFFPWVFFLMSIHLEMEHVELCKECMTSQPCFFSETTKQGVKLRNFTQTQLECWWFVKWLGRPQRWCSSTIQPSFFWSEQPNITQLCLCVDHWWWGKKTSQRYSYVYFFLSILGVVLNDHDLLMSRPVPGERTKKMPQLRPKKPPRPKLEMLQKMKEQAKFLGRKMSSVSGRCMLCCTCICNEYFWICITMYVHISMNMWSVYTYNHIYIYIIGFIWFY